MRLLSCTHSGLVPDWCNQLPFKFVEKRSKLQKPKRYFHACTHYKTSPCTPLACKPGPDAASLGLQGGWVQVPLHLLSNFGDQPFCGFCFCGWAGRDEGELQRLCHGMPAVLACLMEILSVALCSAANQIKSNQTGRN